MIDDIKSHIINDIIEEYNNYFKCCSIVRGMTFEKEKEKCISFIFRDITLYISTLSSKEKLCLYKDCFPSTTLVKNYIEKITEYFMETYVNLVDESKNLYVNILIKKEVFFEDLQKILDNKDKGIQDAIELSGISEYCIGPRSSIFVPPPGCS